MYYSTCSVIAFRNGSIIGDFVLGFTREQNVTRLSSFLNRTLNNKQLFGGIIVSIALNNTDVSDSTNDDDDDDDDDDDTISTKSIKVIMTEQNLANDQQEPSRTTYTTVTYTKLDKGLSITISETITITNNNTNTLDKSPINNNYELILVPSIENTKTIVVPTNETNEISLPSPISPAPPVPPPSPPPATTVTTTRLTKSPSHHQLLKPIKSTNDSNFAYIDESSDDRTFSSGDGII